MDNLKFMKELCRVFGDPTRLKIFDILMTGVHCNCEISELTGLSMNLISHHLKVLQDADLVQSVRNKKDGRWKYYSVNKQKLSVVQTETQIFFNQNRIVKCKPVCPPINNNQSKEKVG